MVRGRGCPLTSLEPRTSDQVLILGEVFFPERTCYSNSVGGFLEELKRTRTRQVVWSPRPTALAALSDFQA